MKNKHSKLFFHKKNQVIALILMFMVIFISYFMIPYINKLQREVNPDDYITTLNYHSFHSGDLIFRRGEGILGQALFQVDKTSPYSHVGIIQVTDYMPFVIHASTGKNLGNDALVVIEDLATFLQRDVTTAIAIYRLKNFDDKISRKAANIAYEYARQKIPFDKEFNLQNPNSVYCTELVWRAYLGAGIDLVDSKFSRLKIPLGQEEYLLPSDLLNSHYLDLIYQIPLEEN
jgi:uncharacterized protein YycO